MWCSYRAVLSCVPEQLSFNVCCQHIRNVLVSWASLQSLVICSHIRKVERPHILVLPVTFFGRIVISKQVWLSTLIQSVISAASKIHASGRSLQCNNCFQAAIPHRRHMHSNAAYGLRSYYNAAYGLQVLSWY